MDPSGLEALQSAYRAAPESKIFAPLGDAYRRAGRLDEAVHVLAQGTARHPDYVSALVLLALCQMDLGREAEAEANLARVLALDPENLVALKSRARRALARGDEAQVATLLELVVSIDPYDREALKLRDDMRARRAMLVELPTPLAPARPQAAPAAGIDTAPPRQSEVAPWSPPPAPARPAMSDAEWDVQRDADHIVVRPRPAPAPSAPASAATTRADEFSTLTLARIYESQGYVEKAIAIYEELQRQQPDNTDIAARLQALRAQYAAPSPPGMAPPPAAPPTSGSDAETSRWRLLGPEMLAAPAEQTAEQLRELTQTVRERERDRRHTQIGQVPDTPPPAADARPPAPQDEPDFERFLRYVRSLKRPR